MGRNRNARALAVIVVASLLPGCIEFGGPLVSDDDDGDADEATDTGTDTDPIEGRCGPLSGVVDHIVDGDTVILASGERIRYLLIDTPETTDGKNECWGAQATEHNAALVLDQPVTLTYDVECEDIYGRLLAYVQVGDLEVNRELLQAGDACYLHIPPNGNGRAAEYQALEDAARDGGVGMWGACGTILCD